MSTTKNATLPEPLLAEMEAAAETQGKTADELLEVAARRYLAHERLQRLARYGRGQARRLGIRESDLPGLIAEARRAPRGR